MEILVTLRKKQLLEKIVPLVDGIIIGKCFVSGYDYELEDLKTVSDYCKSKRCKVYIAMDNFILEDEKMLLYEYFDYIDSLVVDGIIFHDLGVYDAAKSYGLTSKLIYDGKQVLCNSLDTAFMLDQGIDSVILSRELTLNEIESIVKNNEGKVNLQIFGHLRMSFSKRKFLTNYFKEINKEYDYLNKQTLTLVEEQRNYKMPIVEDEYGTFIFTDYIFEMFNEIGSLKPYLKRGIIDTQFIDNDALIIQVCRDLKRTTVENKDFLKQSLLHNFPDYDFSSGYLYQKTNISKDE